MGDLTKRIIIKSYGLAFIFGFIIGTIYSILAKDISYYGIVPCMTFSCGTLGLVIVEDGMKLKHWLIVMIFLVMIITFVGTVALGNVLLSISGIEDPIQKIILGIILIAIGFTILLLVIWRIDKRGVRR